MVTEPLLVEIWVKNKTFRKGFNEGRTKKFYTTFRKGKFRKKKHKKNKYIFRKK
jgi:hypothetical protein